jgi:hypothetical protein
VTIVVDDALTLGCLAGARPPELPDVASDEPFTTTGCWYYRLCRALLKGGDGNLARRVDRMPATDREDLMRRVWSPPPDTLRVLGLSEVAPSAAGLALVHRLNLVSAEALAVALVLDAPVYVERRNDGPLLREAAVESGVEYRAI